MILCKASAGLMADLSPAVQPNHGGVAGMIKQLS